MVSTDLAVIVTDADGNAKTLDSHAPDPGDRPRSIQYGSQIASGFYTSSFNLARPIDAEHTDLHLGDDVRIVGADGDVVWEGWINSLPRSMDTEHSVTVTCSGYMAHAADEPFSQVFIDRDQSRWTGLSTTRRFSLLNTSPSWTIGDQGQDRDTGGNPTVTTQVTSHWANHATSEAWYDAGAGNEIAQVHYTWTKSTNIDHTDTNWQWYVIGVDNDDSLNAQYSANLRAASATPAYFSFPNPHRYVQLQFVSISGPSGGGDGVTYALAWRPTLIGDHGITLIGTEDPKGIAASDAMRWAIDRYCPHLNTAGVQDTTYPISQLVAEETTVYDFLLKLNSFHLWDLACWEDRTVHFKQTDLTDWDYSIRHDDVDVQIGLQGDSFENLRNGIIVKFRNVATGFDERLHPADYPELRDDSIDNPATQHGRRVYGQPWTVPFPTTAANALELGRIKLAEDLQVKAPGSFTVTGRLRDRSGQWVSPSKVRSGDRIRLTSSASLSDRVRLIHEVSYDHSNRSATIAVDSTLQYLDAILDRTTTALTAAGFGG